MFDLLEPARNEAAAVQKPEIAPVRLRARFVFPRGLRGARHSNGHRSGDGATPPRSGFGSDVPGYDISQGNIRKHPHAGLL